MKVYVVNGVPRSGKDTFKNFVEESIREKFKDGQKEVINTSIVDYVKDIASYAGWDGEKTPENRRFLAQLKDILTEWNDSPMNEVKGLIEDLQEEESKENKEFFVFVDMREPADIERLKMYCYKNEIEMGTILLRRHSVEGENYSNHADKSVFDYAYDYIIENNDDLQMLKDGADWFVETHLLKEVK